MTTVPQSPWWSPPLSLSLIVVPAFPATFFPGRPFSPRRHHFITVLLSDKTAPLLPLLACDQEADMGWKTIRMNWGKCLFSVEMFKN